jgi:hypothetical protein
MFLDVSGPRRSFRNWTPSRQTWTTSAYLLGTVVAPPTASSSKLGWDLGSAGGLDVGLFSKYIWDIYVSGVLKPPISHFFKQMDFESPLVLHLFPCDWITSLWSNRDAHPSRDPFSVLDT